MKKYALSLALTACCGAPEAGDAFGGVTDGYEGVTMAGAEGPACPAGLFLLIFPPG